MSDFKGVLTIKQQVYQIIKDDICNGVLKQGERINEGELSSQLNVSKSPIREALIQLVSDGLLIEKSNKGVYVKEFFEDDINYIYEYRVLLESYAIKQFNKNIKKDDLLFFKKCKESFEFYYDNNDLVGFSDEDKVFHQKIVDLCYNTLVIDNYKKSNMMINQFRSYALFKKYRFHESLVEHQKIIDNILCGNYDEAIKANVFHLENAKEGIVKFIDKSS